MSSPSNIQITDAEARGYVFPEASPQAAADRRAALQTISEGTPDEVQQAFGDLEALGDVVPDGDWDEFEDGDDEVGNEADAEMDMGDEDDPFLDGWDEDPIEQPDAPLCPSGTTDSQDELEQGSTWQILISENGSCGFERPHWLKWRPATKRGKDAVDDIDRRIRLFERIASWLTENRGAFLRDPDPWLLGCEALDEMRKGCPSVVPGDFVERAVLRDFAGGSLFSRYRTATLLVWNDATLPLDFIFGDQARMAWVANAVKQYAEELRQPIGDLLDRFKNIKIPKTADGKNELARKPINALDFGEFIARANDMAGTKWANVLGIYSNKITGI